MDPVVEPDLDGCLVDVGGFTLADLAGIENQALAAALRRILVEDDGPDNHVTAFSNRV